MDKYLCQIYDGIIKCFPLTDLKLIIFASPGGAKDSAYEWAFAEAVVRDSVKVDYVFVFPLKPSNREKVQDKAKYTNQLKEGYTNLLSRLHEVGLSAIGRPDAKGSDELLIRVTALDEFRISKEVKNERMLDWLNGISCVKPQSHSDPTSFTSQPSYRPSNRLCHLYSKFKVKQLPISSAHVKSLTEVLSSQIANQLQGTKYTEQIQALENAQQAVCPTDYQSNPLGIAALTTHPTYADGCRVDVGWQPSACPMGSVRTSPLGRPQTHLPLCCGQPEKNLSGPGISLPGTGGPDTGLEIVSWDIKSCK
ncbi:hypothetical protein DFH28DRAFT_1140134 [Melampsora americana]|nr:hypothetical protein DFH28DRAFT_1140134 [Melampsora americana]